MPPDVQTQDIEAFFKARATLRFLNVVQHADLLLQGFELRDGSLKLDAPRPGNIGRTGTVKFMHWKEASRAVQELNRTSSASRRAVFSRASTHLPAVGTRHIGLQLL